MSNLAVFCFLKCLPFFCLPFFSRLPNFAFFYIIILLISLLRANLVILRLRAYFLPFSFAVFLPLFLFYGFCLFFFLLFFWDISDFVVFICHFFSIAVFLKKRQKMKKTAKKLPLPEGDFEINKKILGGDIRSKEIKLGPNRVTT